MTAVTAPVAARISQVSGTRAAPALWHRLACAVPILIAVAAFALYFSVGLLRYLTYHAPAFDLGFFEQVAERTASGHPFSDSFNSYLFLGQHWEPVLILPALLDRFLTPTPIWLILIQSTALAVAPIMAWRLARAWLGGTVPATIAAAATALSPLIADGVAFDYHSEALTPVLALAALDGAARGRTWRFVMPLAALVLVKEDALLVVAGVGWIVWCVHRRPIALWLSGAAIVTAVLLVGVAMPALRAGDPGDLSWRYAYLGGDGPLQWIRGAVLHPLRPLTQLTSSDALIGWLRAFAPLGFLPLLAGLPVLAVIPVLAVELLSAHSSQASLDLQYGLEVFPLLLACALLGWRRMRARWSFLPAGATLLGCTIVAYASTAPMPGGARFDRWTTAGLERRAGVEALLNTIPPDASVAATSGLVAHIANRKVVHEFPQGAQSQYVVIDAMTGPSRFASDIGYWRELTALPQHGYRVIASVDGVTVWSR